MGYVKTKQDFYFRTVKLSTGGTVKIDLPLVRFLRKERLFLKFIRNINRYQKDVFFHKPIKDIILAFPWQEAPEGFAFWSKVSNKYLAELSDEYFTGGPYASPS